MFEASPGWKTMYPQAAIGVLALENASNPASSAELDRQKEALETELRERYGGYGRARTTRAAFNCTICGLLQAFQEGLPCLAAAGIGCAKRKVHPANGRFGGSDVYGLEAYDRVVNPQAKILEELIVDAA